MQGQGWRLEGGRYAPWLPDAQGRWASALGVAFGFEGIWLLVSAADGRTVPREGRILRSVAESRAAGLAEGLLVGRSMLLRLLTVRFGSPPPAVEARLGALTDLAALDALADEALISLSLDAFVVALDAALE